MSPKLLSASIVLLLIVLVSQIRVPMCYSTAEKQQPTESIFYETKIINIINQQIKEVPFYVNINGNSMYPTISSGDTCVCVQKINYEVGDIISFYIPILDNKVELIAHRIIDENNNKFTTKGDNNNIEDSWMINEDQIFCQVPEESLFEKFKFAIESGGRFGVFNIFG